MNCDRDWYGCRHATAHGPRSSAESRSVDAHLGRPNRDQIVSMRPNDLSTLEAIDLANGAQVAKILTEGSARLLEKDWGKQPTDNFVNWLYLQALSRTPTATEKAIAKEIWVIKN